jgi:hypothetical protein
MTPLVKGGGSTTPNARFGGRLNHIFWPICATTLIAQPKGPKPSFILLVIIWAVYLK